MSIKSINSENNKKNGLKHGFSWRKPYSERKNQNFVTDFSSPVSFRPRIVFVFALLFILLSSSVFAMPLTDSAADVLGDGLLKINNFFESRAYEPYAKAIDFFFFSLLFIAIYMMGARYAFKEIKRPEQVIVILLGLMTAFLLVLADISAVILLPYIHWLLYILLFILYWHLLKGIKNPFWRFVLALLLTILTIGLIQGLYNYLKKPKIGGISAPSVPATGIGGFFRDLFGNFRGISVPGVSAPGVPSWLQNLYGAPGIAPTGPTTLPPAVTPTGPTPTGPTSTPPEGPSPLRWLWLLLPLALLALLGYRAWKWGKGREKKKEEGEGKKPEEEAKKEELTIQKIIEEITKIIELKKKILRNIEEIIERKKKATLAFWEVYHKKINDPAFLMDPESEEHKNLMGENDDVTQLLKLELELEANLIELRKIEENLITLKGLNTIREELDIRGAKKGKVLEWGAKISDIYAKTPQAFVAAPPWYIGALGKISKSLMILDPIVMRILSLPNRYPSLRNSIPEKGLVGEVIEAIMKLFLITKNEEEVERQLRKLTDIKAVDAWLKEGKYERWRDLQDKNAQQLKDYFQQQERVFYEHLPEFDANDQLVFDTDNNVVFKSRGVLKPLINRQMRYLQLIAELLKFLESQRKSFTQLQELNVAVQDPNDANKWIDVDPSYYLDPESNSIYNDLSQLDPKNDAEIIERLLRVYDLDRQPIKIFTNFAEGIPPFKVSCYVDNLKKAELTATQKYAVEPVVRLFTIPIPAGKTIGEYEIGQLTPGQHKIAVIAISPRDTYVRASKRTIVVNYRGAAPKPPTLPKRIKDKLDFLIGLFKILRNQENNEDYTAIAREKIRGFYGEEIGGKYNEEADVYLRLIDKIENQQFEEVIEDLTKFRNKLDKSIEAEKRKRILLKYKDYFEKLISLRNELDLLIKSLENILKKAPKIKIEIVQPQKDPKPSFLIGGQVYPLEAEAMGIHKDIGKINDEQGYRFAWYVEQGGKSRRVHTGRSATNSIDAIPPIFDEGEAKLKVVVYKQTTSYEQETEIIAEASIEVLLSRKGGALVKGEAMPALITGFDFDVGVAENKGRKRIMEDSNYFKKNFMGKDFWLFGGVYDGYAGKDAAEIAKSSLHRAFKEYLKHGDVKLAFAQAYDSISNAIKKSTKSGSTAANVFIAGVRLWAAHAGDSKIIICQNDRLVFSTTDHNPTNPEETKIILARGGRIIGDRFFIDNRILPVSRALGDRELSYVLWSKPDVYEMNLAQLAERGSVRIVISSHGIFEKVSPEEAAAIVNSYESAKDSAKNLINLAFIRGATENLTAIVVKLIPKTKGKKIIPIEFVTNRRSVTYFPSQPISAEPRHPKPTIPSQIPPTPSILTLTPDQTRELAEAAEAARRKAAAGRRMGRLGEIPTEAITQPTIKILAEVIDKKIVLSAEIRDLKGVDGYPQYLWWAKNLETGSNNILLRDDLSKNQKSITDTVNASRLGRAGKYEIFLTIINLNAENWKGELESDRVEILIKNEDLI